MKWPPESEYIMLQSLERLAKKSNLISFLDKNYFRRSYFRTVENTCSELLRIQTLSELERKKIQNQRLFELLNYAGSHCPYYQKLFRERNFHNLSPENLEKLPVLSKEMVRKHARDMISRGASRMFLVRRNTGGSTGEPLEFFSDMKACAIDLAHHQFLYRLMGYQPGDVIAGAGGIPIPENERKKNIYWIQNSKHNLWWHFGFSAIFLNDRTIPFYVDCLRKLRPAILRGYPSFWDAIAVYLINHKIKIDFPVKGANLTAEVCLDAQRQRIEQAFGTKVFLEYGQTELSVFCYTNGSSYLYQTSPLYGYLEVLKENGEQARAGEEGEVIATSLCNWGMPFIRYQTGDRVRVSRREGGMLWFDHFEGRTQDYIFDKNQQRVALTALIFGQHFKAFKNIIQWQFIQNRIGHLLIKIMRGPNYSEADEKEIINKIINSAPIDVTFQYDAPMSLNKSGKHLFLLQHCQ